VLHLLLLAFGCGEALLLLLVRDVVVIVSESECVVVVILTGRALLLLLLLLLPGRQLLLLLLLLRPDIHWSPRHRMPFSSMKEDIRCVSWTCRAMGLACKDRHVKA